MFKRSYIKGHEGHPHYIDDGKLQKLKISLGSINKQEDITIILKALSDPTKLSIYLLLRQVEEIPVTDIVHILDSNPSSVSHALSDLKKLGLVECSRCGQLMCYSLKKQPQKRRAILTLVERMFI